MAIDGIVGLQRGDEGKGRFVDMWADGYDVIARFNGGPNAGHTVVMPDNRELKLHGIPSGIGYPGKMNVIGDGVFVDANKLCNEIDELKQKDVDVTPDNLMISSSAHLILPHHVLKDIRRESGEKGQGSTKSGISYVDADVSLREGLRAETINEDPTEIKTRIVSGLKELGPISADEFVALGGDSEEEVADKYAKSATRLAGFVTDTMIYLNKQLAEGKNILAEGAQAFLLDKYQGMWPNTSSSITTSAGVAPGLGVPPQSLNKVLGVVKAIPSYVGGGHFVTQGSEADQQLLHGNTDAPDAEKGTTTGRMRRLGHLDLAQIRRANLANGTTEIAITKLDWMNRYQGVIPVCVAYERKGKRLEVAPNAEYKLVESTPVYEELPAWTEDISGVRKFEELPQAAQDFIIFIEEALSVPVSLIGVGQRRDQVIVR